MRYITCIQEVVLCISNYVRLAAIAKGVFRASLQTLQAYDGIVPSDSFLQTRMPTIYEHLTSFDPHK